MKYLLICVLFNLSGIVYGLDESMAGLPGWTITSDVKDDSIPAGDVIIEGNIKMFSSANPLSEVRVGTNSNETLSDSLGNFTLNAKATDTVFYCYRSGWYEIYELNPNFESQHRITVSVYLNQERQLMKKPVIYLYNDAPIEAEVKIVPKGEFTFTYPKHDKGWSVAIQPNGGLLGLKSNKEFPYLFWEAETQDLFFDFTEKQMEGWIIKTDTCVSFLENQLTALGLNEVEQTDFITFWAPILSKNEYAVVQFLLDDAYQNKIAEIQITPKPDAMRRVYLLMSPLDNAFIGLNMVPQTFEPFQRKGFTVLEWGGTELNFLDLKF
ncbi:MAG: hypothetical protein GQ574_25095 [Crocinitomix sp.]|nr:hypothetical protein [Crocinitomix sp.]